MSEATEPRVLPEIAMNDELAKAIQSAISSEDVKSLIIAEAEKQVAAKAALDADQAAATQAATDKAAAEAAASAAAIAAQPFTRTESIGGREFTFEAPTEAELDRVILNAYKVAYAVREPEASVVDPAIAAAEAQKTVEAEVLAKAEAERKFKSGEISAADYFEQSGALATYLEKNGLSLEALKGAVNANQSTQFELSWKQAGEEFKRSAGGLDWPGGEKNQELIGLKIAAMGLVDAPDKVAALNAAYAELKRTGLYFPQGDGAATHVVDSAAPAADAAVAAANAAAAKAAADAAATRAAATARVASMSSSIFGASSGTSGAPAISPAVAAAKAIVPADATPAEIMQAWKEAQLTQGINPDDALRQSHRANAR